MRMEGMDEGPTDGRNFLGRHFRQCETGIKCSRSQSRLTGLFKWTKKSGKVCRALCRVRLLPLCILKSLAHISHTQAGNKVAELPEPRKRLVCENALCDFEPEKYDRRSSGINNVRLQPPVRCGARSAPRMRLSRWLRLPSPNRDVETSESRSKSDRTPTSDVGCKPTVVLRDDYCASLHRATAARPANYCGCLRESRSCDSP